jgi:hypothetical protein
MEAVPMRASVCAAAMLISVGAAEAHEAWADGSTIPAWVKLACCGPSDAHRLRPEQVHRVSAEYYAVDGFYSPVPARDALPSQDGQYWIFYKDNKSGGQTGAFCFFVPMDE